MGEFINKPLSELKPYKNNPRKISRGGKRCCGIYPEIRVSRRNSDRSGWHHHQWAYSFTRRKAAWHERAAL